MTHNSTQHHPTEVIEVPHAQGCYPVYIGKGLLSNISLWGKHLTGTILVVTEDRVAALYQATLKQALKDHAKVAFLSLPPGESTKSIAHWSSILDELVSMNAQRDATIIALGGGVVGDLAGFAAASYMRGISVVQMPTTLLAQVDAAIGGKTGINHPMGKNLIGAFHAPQAVVIDLSTLATLEQRDYQAGLAEVIKYGAIGDIGFFAWLESQIDALNQRDIHALQAAVERSVSAKKKVVVADEKESGQRALLNFGHTFGHALETLTGYETLLHGEAVAIGMVLASRLSERLGMAPTGTTHRLTTLIDALGLPTTLPAGHDPQTIIERMRLDKKNRDNTIRLVLLEELGQACLKACAEDDIIQAFA